MKVIKYKFIRLNKVTKPQWDIIVDKVCGENPLVMDETDRSVTFIDFPSSSSILGKLDSPLETAKRIISPSRGVRVDIWEFPKIPTHSFTLPLTRRQSKEDSK